ncbi:hypothetical protein [Paramuribaculum intestinale]|mgnify:CR=1 FL=1|uniref:hypothetical protein n=1 Tax=Paramuribaculum intestinale TaxID=2094151 RepID=UPI000FFE952E|nr:hypothetical protein [Paramuribaculum intestinale]RXE61965.1 hypothetical protein ED375_07250 [Muribaculaceae bacterium Isolate-004 (NCI)]
MANSIKGSEVSVPIWGGHEPALLTSWSELKRLDFKKRDRSFGTLDDGTQALFFYAVKHCCSLSDEQLNECRYKWYVTTETLDEISD